MSTGASRADAAAIASAYAFASPISSGRLTVSAASRAWAAIVTDSVFTCPSQAAAAALSARGVDARMYLFAHAPTCTYVGQPLLGVLGAAHSFELPFVFATPASAACNVTAGELRLERRMAAAWVAFFHNALDAAVWPSFEQHSAAAMRFGSFY